MAKQNPEHKARNKVHDKMAKPYKEGPYRQSTAGTYTNGTPDFYYEGCLSELWVEWKYTYASFPRTLPVPTDLQIDWLVRAHKNGRKVAVIEACPIGYRIYPGLTWREGPVVSPIEVTRECALWITSITGLNA